MKTPHMKMTTEELQEEQLRNAAEATAIYWYPGEFNGVRQFLALFASGLGSSVGAPSTADPLIR
jgi:hypothetical protein